MTEPSQDEINRRANEKARKRKAARDKILATKTVEKGLLIVHTGKGKGKSTAAFGLVLRALGNGMRVGIVQFVKGKWQTGERPVLERFADQIDLRVSGEGFTWETQDRARDIAAAEAGWAAAKEMIEAARQSPPKYDMLVLVVPSSC
ncbi:MAG: cob(I)yrinic acid a,c-diamide adenosyltransferase [Proteobacteria bacterium]|nr:cob(I)yrinic acid a,c-diamide adenosyltransferase [Pseudomonadota bacterium]